VYYGRREGKGETGRKRKVGVEGKGSEGEWKRCGGVSEKGIKNNKINLEK
jgi:hypothetical protein